MNLPFVISGILLVLLGLIHSLLGEKLILIPVLKREMPKLMGSDFLTRRTLRFAWHITTVLCWGMGVILIYYATDKTIQRDPVILHTIAMTSLICGFISLLIARGRHFSWWVCFLISGLIWWGMARGG